MKKLKVFSNIAAIIVSVLVVSVLLVFQALNEKNYDKVMTEYISLNISRDITVKADIIREIRRFVHYNVHPVQGEGCRSDTVAIDKLVYGIGWCDQTSRVFMQLAKSRGITTRLLFLKNANGTSPHSIVEASLDSRWVIIDPAYDIEFMNKDGSFASMEDIRKDFSIVLDNPKIKLFGLYNAYWADSAYLSCYYREPEYITEKKGRAFNSFKVLPKSVGKLLVKVLTRAYIVKTSSLKAPEARMYFEARVDHLIGDYKHAEILYNRIIDNKSFSTFKDRCYFFLGLLYYDKGDYDGAVVKMDALLENYANAGWIPYAYGFKSMLLKKLGDKEKAGLDMDKFSYLPDAYF